ncbi:MAG: MgtC/SapB family protein [Atopobiaceae bacterium]|jgi:putative Mg2+ transporter-C (MgtC) family protein
MLGIAVSNLFAAARGWTGTAVFLRLLAATIVGIVVGVEREYRNKDAGIKTHVLVCVGAAVTMIVSEYLVHQFPDESHDMARIGAQVISGVGFLGVGTIIVTGKNEVQGLTTAAGLWVCACIGLLAGAGYIEGTLLALGFVVFTYLVLNKIDTHVRQNGRVFDLYVEFDDKGGVKEMLRTLHSWNCSYTNFQLAKGVAGNFGGAATFTVKIPRTQHKEPFIASIQALDCVTFVDELR